jgi:NAD(P)-dependent dehydrogenase (short-subunit alcohol dehydrogenase family)
MKTMGKDRVVVITGASAGLGRATARAFARRGARLGLIARDRVRLDAACDEARDLGSEAIALPLDVSDSDAVETAADRVEASPRARVPALPRSPCPPGRPAVRSCPARSIR